MGTTVQDEFVEENNEFSVKLQGTVCSEHCPCNGTVIFNGFTMCLELSAVNIQSLFWKEAVEPKPVKF